MIIKNGNVFTGKFIFEQVDILIRDGLIENVYERGIIDKVLNKTNEKTFGDDTSVDEAYYKVIYGEEVIDAEGKYVIPGLIDIHFHGCLGHDFSDADVNGLEVMADYQLKHGITSICPASMTFDEERLIKIFKTAKEYRNAGGDELVGINMEGPFISYEKRGAQNADYIVKPDRKMFERLKEAAGGLIKLVAIAPETEGTLDFIREESGSVHVSIAHTTADYELSGKAFKAGADHVTHLYNAMPEFSHRSPGVVGAAFDNENVYVELITDGIHVDPSVVRAGFKMFGSDRIVLVSDSMQACGMPDGEYELGGQKVIVKGNKATLADGTIAGSVSNLMDCVRNCVMNMHISLEDAIKCASANPAKSIGIFDRYGSIEKGKAANIVIMDDFEICNVISKGEIYI